MTSNALGSVTPAPKPNKHMKSHILAEKGRVSSDFSLGSRMHRKMLEEQPDLKTQSASLSGSTLSLGTKKRQSTVHLIN